MFITGAMGCWTRMNSDTGLLDPLGASQDLKLEHIIYQEAGEYRCVTPSLDPRRKLDSLRKTYNVQVIVTGKLGILFLDATMTSGCGCPQKKNLQEI